MKFAFVFILSCTSSFCYSQSNPLIRDIDSVVNTIIKGKNLTEKQESGILSESDSIQILSFTDTYFFDIKTKQLIKVERNITTSFTKEKVFDIDQVALNNRVIKPKSDSVVYKKADVKQSNIYYFHKKRLIKVEVTGIKDSIKYGGSVYFDKDGYVHFAKVIQITGLPHFVYGRLSPLVNDAHHFLKIYKSK